MAERESKVSASNAAITSQAEIVKGKMGIIIEGTSGEAPADLDLDGSIYTVVKRFRKRLFLSIN